MFAGAIGGAVAALTNALPIINMINCFCCLGIMSGGAVGLLFYDRNQPEREYISPALAVTIGLTGGIIGAFFSVILEGMVYMVLGDWQLEFMRMAMNNMQEIPPMLEELLAEAEKEALNGFNFIASLFRDLIIIPLFSLAGALIVRVFLNRKR